MTFNALADLRRTLQDRPGAFYDDAMLQRLLASSARETARLALTQQEQRPLELVVGQVSYPMPPRWIRSFAILHEDLQSYVALKDQLGQTWYLLVDDQTQALTVTNEAPVGIRLNPGTFISWFLWQAPDATSWYVWPSLLGDGSVELAISETPPLIGTGSPQTLELRTVTGRRFLVSVSHTQILDATQQSYVVLSDQADGLWYLVLEPYSLTPTLTDVEPMGERLAPAEAFYWFQWQSPDLTYWYLYPALLEDGSVELAVSDTAPALGTGTNQTLELRTSLSMSYRLGVSDLGELTVVAATIPPADLHAIEAPDVLAHLTELVLTAPPPMTADLAAGSQPTTALTLVRPEAWGHLDPDLPAGPPRYATTYQGRLWVHPTPDARYHLDHKYFTIPWTDDATYTLPEAFQQVPLWMAASQAVRSEGRGQASQTLQAMGAWLLTYLGGLYVPVERDSREEYPFPR